MIVLLLGAISRLSSGDQLAVYPTLQREMTCVAVLGNTRIAEDNEIAKRPKDPNSCQPPTMVKRTLDGRGRMRRSGKRQQHARSTSTPGHWEDIIRHPTESPEVIVE
ncbi:hypothetical protein F4819DRAFT_487004 [Hypoxylon fuscum]|nr:hypothetical protein F4819DRAFT_487004 [Hypoxylon fuscum]